MAEQGVIQQTQQTEPVRVVVEQPPEISPEDRLWNAMYPPQQERPRAPDGKFVSTKPQEQPQQEVQHESQQPEGQGEQEAQGTEETQPAEDASPVWDDVKEVKLKIPLKIGDKESQEELTINELRDGYLRTKDYTQKTMELAEQRRQAEAQAMQAVAQHRHQYVQALMMQQRMLVETTAPELQGMTQEAWTKLSVDDPAEYVRRKQRVEGIQQAYNSFQQRINAEMQQQRAMEQQSEAQAVEQAKQKIVSTIPEWNEDLYKAIQKRGVETYGFTPQEMAMAYDDRFVRMLVDLEKYHKMREQKPAVEKKVQAVPPVLRPGNKQPQANKGLQQLKEARERAKGSTSLDSAVDVFKAMGF